MKPEIPAKPSYHFWSILDHKKTGLSPGQTRSMSLKINVERAPNFIPDGLITGESLDLDQDQLG